MIDSLKLALIGDYNHLLLLVVWRISFQVKANYYLLVSRERHMIREAIEMVLVLLKNLVSIFVFGLVEVFALYIKIRHGKLIGSAFSTLKQFARIVAVKHLKLACVHLILLIFSSDYRPRELQKLLAVGLGRKNGQIRLRSTIERKLVNPVKKVLLVAFSFNGQVLVNVEGILVVELAFKHLVNHIAYKHTYDNDESKTCA